MQPKQVTQISIQCKCTKNCSTLNINVKESVFDMISTIHEYVKETIAKIESENKPYMISRWVLGSKLPQLKFHVALLFIDTECYYQLMERTTHLDKTNSKVWWSSMAIPVNEFKMKDLFVIKQVVNSVLESDCGHLVYLKGKHVKVKTCLI